MNISVVCVLSVLFCKIRHSFYLKFLTKLNYFFTLRRRNICFMRITLNKKHLSMQKNFYRTLSLVALSAILATGSAAVKEKKEIKRDLSTISGLEFMGRKGNISQGRIAPDASKLPAKEKISIGKSNIPMKDSSIPEDIIVNEDFSLWYEGTEEDPVYTADIPDFWIDPSQMWDISPDRTQQPGWAGQALYCAGGVCGLCYPNYGGFIQTPQGDYSGSLKISFKAKVSESDKAKSPKIYVILANGNWYYGNPIEYSTFDVEKDGEWHEFEFEFENTYGGDDCFFQFNTYDLLYIDDVVITTAVSTLPHPVMKPATDFTLTGFTANWGEVVKATDYLLTCYRNVPISDKNVWLEEGFEAVKSTDGKIDWENPAIPEGWEIDMTTVATGESAIDGNVSLCFDESGQSIATPYTGSLILHAQATFRTLSGVEEIYDPETGELLGRDVSGYLQLEGWDGFQWKYTGVSYYIAPYAIDQPDVMDFDNEVSGLYYQMRLTSRNFYGTPENPVILALDNFIVETLPASEKDYAVKDLPVEGTSYVFTDLDPVSDYYYYTIARNTDTGITSGEPDAGTFAFGICAPTPLEATDITEEGYTANWEALAKAQGYEVESLKVFTANEDIKDYEVIIETFAPISNIGYTVENPFVFNNGYLMSLDGFCDNNGWVGYLCGLADSAVGGIGISMFGISGQIQTPFLSLQNNGGKYNLTFSACGTPGDYLYVINSKGFGTVVSLSDDYDGYFLEMENGCEFDYLAFYTAYGTPFFINYLDITQDISKGDKLYTVLETVQVDDINSFRFETPEITDDSFSYAFDVTAKHSFLSNTAWSVRSKVQPVEDTTTLVNNIKDNGSVVRAGKGTIEVTTFNNERADIFTIDGKHISSFLGSKKINVAPGIYVVNIDNKPTKVLVK